MKKKLMAAALTALFSGSCTSAGSAHSYIKTNITAASTASPLTGVQTAKNGDYLLKQEFTAAQMISLTEPLEVIGLNDNVDIFISPADILYAVNVEAYGKIYCTTKAVTRFAKTAKRPMAKSEMQEKYDKNLPLHPICLRDSDGDGRLDKMQSLNNWEPANAYTVQMVVTDIDLGTSSGFEPANPENAPRINVGIKLDGNKLRLAHSVENGDVVSYRETLSTLGEFPRIAELHGARFELLAYEDKTLTYKILSGFSNNTNLQIICYRGACSPEGPDAK